MSPIQPKMVFDYEAPASFLGGISFIGGVWTFVEGTFAATFGTTLFLVLFGMSSSHLLRWPQPCWNRYKTTICLWACPQILQRPACACNNWKSEATHGRRTWPNYSNYEGAPPWLWRHTRNTFRILQRKYATNLPVSAIMCLHLIIGQKECLYLMMSIYKPTSLDLLMLNSFSTCHFWVLRVLILGYIYAISMMRSYEWRCIWVS